VKTRERQNWHSAGAVATCQRQSQVRTQPLRPLKHGDVLVLRDEDYLFGNGSLVVRVLVIYEFREVRRQPWVFLRGLELRADGHGRRVRDVLVRSAALGTRRRRPE
jgi:hypothetical protein